MSVMKQRKSKRKDLVHRPTLSACKSIRCADITEVNVLSDFIMLCGRISIRFRFDGHGGTISPFINILNTKCIVSSNSNRKVQRENTHCKCT